MAWIHRRLLPLLCLLCLAFILGGAARAADEAAFLLPDSADVLLSEQRLAAEPYERLGFMMREILARHGFRFEAGSRYDAYFRDTGWYRPGDAGNQAVYDRLSETEWRNLELLRRLREKKQPEAGQPARTDGILYLDPLYVPDRLPLTAVARIGDAFHPLDLPGRPPLPVYAAPDRQSPVMMALDSSHPLSAAGRVNGFLFVRYEDPDGVFHTGYVDEADLPRPPEHVAALTFLYGEITVTGTGLLYDDPVNGEQIGALPEGQRVVLLFYCGGADTPLSAYVETRFGSLRVRGFLDGPGLSQASCDDDLLSRETVTRVDGGPAMTPRPAKTLSDPIVEQPAAADPDDPWATVKSEMTALTDFLRAGHFDDYNSEAAYAAVEGYLRAREGITGIVRDGTRISFTTADGFRIAYTGEPEDENAYGGGPAQQAFEDFLDRKPLDRVFLKSGIPITNNHFMCLAPCYQNQTIQYGFDYMYAKMSETAQRLGYPEMLSRDASTGQEAWDRILRGEINDTGLLVLIGHGLRPTDQERQNGTYVLYWGIDEADTVSGLTLMGNLDYNSLQAQYTDGQPNHIFMVRSPNGNRPNTFTYSVYVSSRYLEILLTDRTFDNTVVYLVVCNALLDERAYMMFIDRGASMVIGSSYALGNFTANAILHNLLNRIETDGQEIYFTTAPGISPDYIEAYLADYNAFVIAIGEETQVSNALTEEDILAVYRHETPAGVSQQDVSTLWGRLARTYAQYRESTQDGGLRMIPSDGNTTHRVFNGRAPIRGAVYSRIPSTGASQPLAGAEVRFYRWINHTFEEGPVVYTDRDGAYRIDDLPYGIWGIEARYGDDFTAATVVEHIADPGHPETEADTLYLSVWLDGYVVTQFDRQDNAPAAGAAITAVQDGRKYTGQTDADGYYRIFVHPGRTAIIAEYADASGNAVDESLSFTLTRDSHTAPTIICGYTLSGNVYDAVTGRPIAGAEVQTDIILYCTGTTDTDGAWYTNTSLNNGLWVHFRMDGYDNSDIYFGGLPYGTSHHFDTELTPARKYVVFGHYEQDGDTANGPEPIEWIPVTDGEGRQLLVSRYILNFGPYHSNYADVTWSGSEMRAWLNSTFIADAFTEAEQAMLLPFPVRDDPAGETDDRVFLLSAAEAAALLPDDRDRKAQLTDYAARFTDVHYYDARAWYLRTPGTEPCYVATVDTDGRIDPVGYPVRGNAEPGIRPVIMPGAESVVMYYDMVRHDTGSGFEGVLMHLRADSLQHPENNEALSGAVSYRYGIADENYDWQKSENGRYAFRISTRFLGVGLMVTATEQYKTNRSDAYLTHSALLDVRTGQPVRLGSLFTDNAARGRLRALLLDKLEQSPFKDQFYSTPAQIADDFMTYGAAWELTDTDFIIKYDEYELGPRSIGSFQIAFSLDGDLAGVISDDFRPKTYVTSGNVSLQTADQLPSDLSGWAVFGQPGARFLRIDGSVSDLTVALDHETVAQANYLSRAIVWLRDAEPGAYRVTYHSGGSEEEKTWTMGP